MRYILILCVTSLYVGLAKKLPPEFQTCKLGAGEEFNACMKSAIQNALPLLRNGIASLNVLAAEPLTAEKATIIEGQGNFRVEQNFRNVKMHGVTNTTVDKTEATFQSSTFSVVATGHAPQYIFEADYTMEGQILLLAVKGTGKCTAVFVNPKPRASISGEMYTKKGKDYLKVKNASLDFNPEKVVFHFDNLFGGDAALGAQMNRLLNENWKEFYDALEPQYTEIQNLLLKNFVSGLFSQVPLDDLFPN